MKVCLYGAHFIVYRVQIDRLSIGTNPKIFRKFYALLTNEPKNIIIYKN